MLGSLLKKKLSDEKIANIFVNALFDAVDNGFQEVVSLVNEDPAFVNSPSLKAEDNGPFTLVILVANLSTLESTFEAEQANRVEQLIFDKCGKAFGMEAFKFQKVVREFQHFISRVNHPSKNMIYGMSKAFFYKYELSRFQDEYFRRMQVPNPLFLKRMDEIMQNFLWDWDAFMKKYRLDF